MMEEMMASGFMTQELLASGVIGDLYDEFVRWMESLIPWIIIGSEG